MKIFLINHFSSSEERKIIGVFNNQEKCDEILNTLKSKPGFEKDPKLIKNLETEKPKGFYISEFIIDELTFKTVMPQSEN